MKRLVISGIISLLVTVALIAQTTVTKGPVDTSMKIAWDLASNTPLSAVPTIEFRLYDSLTPATVILLTGVTCTAGAVAVNCTAPLVQSVVDIINKLGAHSLTLTVFRSDVGESLPSVPFTLVTPAGAPTNLKITK